MKDHIVSAFTDELDQLTSDLLHMGGLAESMIIDACQSVIAGDVSVGEDVAQRDRDVDAIEMEIQRRITRVLALRQPMAQDLREVLSALRISSELERIGDLSKNIAKRTETLKDLEDRDVLGGVRRMGKAVGAQLHAVLDAYATRNEALAMRVWRSDEDVDHHYNSYFREVLTYMMEDPRTIGLGAHILFIAKNLERVGDHCTNIAEDVHFLATGETLVGDERPKATELKI